MTSLILGDQFSNLFLHNEYNYQYLDKYIPYFTSVSLVAFILAHIFSPQRNVTMKFNLDVLNRILNRYYWIMWLNFCGGVLRILLMVSLVGFSNVMDYRLAAEHIMNTGLGPVGLVFRITNYIQLLANFYIALRGFNDGFKKLNLKQILVLFILYSPPQMATGGRLFILYFVLFYFGTFLLGRGIYYKYKRDAFLAGSEKKALLVVFGCLFSLVSVIAMMRSNDSNQSVVKQESAMAKFTYVAEGMLETEYYMRHTPPEVIEPDYGNFLFGGYSADYISYRKELVYSKLSSIVLSIITPLYVSFGYWGSIIVWGIIAFLFELVAILCLRKLTLMDFFIYLVILKIMYESVISNSIGNNIPVFELLILLAIFQKLIFGNLDTKGKRGQNRLA